MRRKNNIKQDVLEKSKDNVHIDRPTSNVESMVIYHCCSKYPMDEFIKELGYNWKRKSGNKKIKPITQLHHLITMNQGVVMVFIIAPKKIVITFHPFVIINFTVLNTETH